MGSPALPQLHPPEGQGGLRTLPLWRRPLGGRGAARRELFGRIKREQPLTWATAPDTLLLNRFKNRPSPTQSGGSGGQQTEWGRVRREGSSRTGLGPMTRQNPAGPKPTMPRRGVPARASRAVPAALGGESRGRESEEATSAGREQKQTSRRERYPRDVTTSVGAMGFPTESGTPPPLASPGAARFRPPSVYQTLKLVLAVGVAVVAFRALGNSFLSLAVTFGPPLLTYATMGLVFWPWLAALALAALTGLLAAGEGAAKRELALRSQREESSGRVARPWTYLLRQFVILSGALTWLILVPCGHFQGFLGAWPLLLFSVYVLFFAESAFIRCYLYGDLASRSADKQWATRSSRLSQIFFIVALVAGHWYAAKESPLLAMAMAGRAPGWNVPAAVLLFCAVWLHWDATLILGEYFDRLVPPREVVTSGPYRWVRHPIYTSYMLLFCGFCAGLRSYGSLVFLLSVCIWYYSMRTKLEEEQLMEYFGDEYGKYRSKVDKKFLPFVF